jgi:hypothetical protein
LHVIRWFLFTRDHLILARSSFMWCCIICYRCRANQNIFFSRNTRPYVVLCIHMISCNVVRYPVSE